MSAKSYIDVPAGMVLLQEGDIVQVGSSRYMVEYVNESRTRCLPMGGQREAYTTRFGEEVEFTRSGSYVNLSRTTSPDRVLERTGLAGLREFLAASASRRKSNSGGANNINDEGTTTMAREKKSARGGLAAEAAAAKTKTSNKSAKAGKPAKDGSPSKGKLGQVMGHSTCSVVRKLAAEGCSNLRVAAIMAKAGAKPSPATLQIQCSWGRSGKESPAPLTGDQVKELLALAPEPPAPAKAAKEEKAA